MNIEVKKLTPELLEDYLHFFDTTPHYTNKEEDRCYCVGWSNADYENKDFSTAEKRREAAITYINGNNVQGYLVYFEGRVVGWCNANTKTECFKCQYGRMYLGYTVQKDFPDEKVKSVFCFTIAPEMRRMGVAELLLQRVCEDAARNGFDFVEAYPNTNFINPEADCMGPVKLFEKLGFTVCYEIVPKLVMRKKLR